MREAGQPGLNRIPCFPARRKPPAGVFRLRCSYDRLPLPLRRWSVVATDPHAGTSDGAGAGLAAWIRGAAENSRTSNMMANDISAG